ncbi:MAG: MFS transporter, partial [Clostridia bacterium]|nr:MFS transporter [Clostridia bacterium]
SSKALWVGADLYDDLLRFGFFFFGLYKKNYLNVKPMLFYYGFRELMSKLLFGVNKVINADLLNEAMDYCEWKNGYRMEATTGVAKDLVIKIQGTVMNSVNSLVMKKIGYDQSLKIGKQSERTKFWLFALCSVVPVVSGALGVVPKLLWPITKKTREQMYRELAEHRSRMIRDNLENT